MAARGKANGGLQAVLRPIWDRLRILEGALGDVHPEYAERAVTRCENLVAQAAGHVNETLRLVKDQKVGLGVVMNEAHNIKIDIQNTCTSLHQASVRHKKDAQDLRSELGELKEHITEQARLVEYERKQCELSMQSMKLSMQSLQDSTATTLNLLKEEQAAFATKLKDMQENVHFIGERIYLHRNNLFGAQQAHLVAVAKHTPEEDLRAHMERSQSAASNRSPSSQRIAKAQAASRQRANSRQPVLAVPETVGEARDRGRPAM